MLKVSLKDGSVKEYAVGTTVAEVAKSLGAGLYKAACSAKVDGRVCDLRTELMADCALEIMTFDDDEGKKTFWHTSSHILAQAVMRLYPQARLAIGPAIDGGFYYDIDIDPPFSGEDLQKIEDEMKSIVTEGSELARFELPVAEALELMADEPYKKELIEEHAAEGGPISFYRQGDFVDLCAGPHLLSTAPVKAIKLTQCTGAYWRGDAQNKMLCRVYGVSFPKQSQLDEHLKMLEEAKRRDHRRLGKELELYDIFEEGPGFPVFFAKGMVIRNELEAYWRKVHRESGYVEIRTPQIMSRHLWETSGHWFHYRQNMYTTTIDDEAYAIKPMNCPGGILVYKSRPRSYRDLPLRMGELGSVHRHELSGALHGLMRVRCFTQDDAHLFITEEQITDEVVGVIRKIDKIYSTFGFEYRIELSTRPENSMGEAEQWEQATDALRKALEIYGRPYKLNEGDGAFYGPKIDFHLKDAIGRTWQCGTIQLDFQMPEKFDMSYIGADDEKHRPIMIHTTSYGSLERFMGILTEQFVGAFPLWLAPEQVRVIPVSEKHLDYAEQVAELFRARDIRVDVDERNEKIGYKIREAQLDKIPYMLIVGDKEIAEQTVSLRSRAQGDLGSMAAAELVEQVAKEIRERAL